MQAFYLQFKTENLLANFANLLDKSTDGMLIYRLHERTDLDTFLFMPEDDTAV